MKTPRGPSDAVEKGGVEVQLFIWRRCSFCHLSPVVAWSSTHFCSQACYFLYKITVMISLLKKNKPKPFHTWNLSSGRDFHQIYGNFTLKQAGFSVSSAPTFTKVHPKMPSFLPWPKMTPVSQRNVTEPGVITQGPTKE